MAIKLSWNHISERCVLPLLSFVVIVMIYSIFFFFPTIYAVDIKYSYVSEIYNSPATTAYIYTIR